MSWWSLEVGFYEMAYLITDILTSPTDDKIGVYKSFLLFILITQQGIWVKTFILQKIKANTASFLKGMQRNDDTDLIGNLVF